MEHDIPLDELTIKLTIRGATVLLTIPEAKTLYFQLHDLFGPKYATPTIPIIPIYPVIPVCPATPLFPMITYQGAADASS